MLYKIKFKPGIFKKVFDEYSLTNINKPVQILIYGQPISNYKGKCVWNGTGPARNALRLILQSVLGYNQRKEINNIMKNYVGTKPSYPIYLKEI